VSKIRTRFKSFRTDYVKLKKKVKDQQAKSGTSPKRLTRLQQFKMSRGKFLDAFCRQSATAQEMGPVSIDSTVSASACILTCCLYNFAFQYNRIEY